MKKINLEEILEENTNTGHWSATFKANVLSAMRDSCEKTVELCAENFMDSCIEDSTKMIRQYILSTKDQII